MREKINEKYSGKLGWSKENWRHWIAVPLIEVTKKQNLQRTLFSYTFEGKSKGKDQTNVGFIKKGGGFVLSNQYM